ncbi:MAG: glycosyltransferase family 2 protein [Frankia sp.]
MQAGPVVQIPRRTAYRVSFRSLTVRLRSPRLAISGRLLSAAASVVFTALFFVVLVSSSSIHGWLHNPARTIADLTMVVAVAVIGLLMFTGSFTVSRATLTARHPQPVMAERTLRVAFVTTIVPDREPPETVRSTLVAAAALRWPADRLDVWLLDESSADPTTAATVRSMCAQLGIGHFSRFGVERFNRPSGRYATRTKHGNLNSWLETHGDHYDVLVAVDPDHRPLPNMLERLLGYFRDPDVAFVVGPQEYGNFSSSLVARWAQYQQHFFHGILQPAGNAAGCAMHVGTNYAFRIGPLRQVGGFQDSVTEDMATGLAVHKTRNPETGQRWRSVYTPDVLAIGEGPTTWTDYFTQQERWSRGTIEIWLHQFFPGARRLGRPVFWHYLLLMSYYPATATAWVLGALNSALYLGFGVSSINISENLWLVLYAWAFASQLAIFLLGRSHTVSPFEPEGSLGLAGLLMSILSTPIYVASLLSALLGRPARFVVTPKGAAAGVDHLRTFRTHLRWAAFFALLLAVSQFTGNDNLAMRMWAVIPLAVCLAPVGLWLLDPRTWRRRPWIEPAVSVASAASGASAGGSVSGSLVGPGDPVLPAVAGWVPDARSQAEAEAAAGAGAGADQVAH